MTRARVTRTRSADVHRVSALLGAGRPLDEHKRLLYEARLEHSLRDVRVHEDEAAAFAARSIGARGFALGRDVVLDAAGDERLLAHELAHVVQQERVGPRRDPETGARLSERGAVSPRELGTAAPGLYAQDDEERRTTTSERAFTVDWESALRRGRFSLGVGPLVPPPGLGRLGPSLTPPALPSPALVPPASTGATDPGAGPSLPSRLPVATSGSFSLGLRLNFPEPEAREIPGAPASALTESLRRAELTNQFLTGRVPQGWDAIDKGQLARAVWGIFSTHLAPDVAKRLTSRLTATGRRGGLSYELDLVLLTDFSGGGLSFSVQY